MEHILLSNSYHTNEEKELDQILIDHINDIDVEHIMIQDEISNDYLLTIMDKLQALYIQASELTLENKILE
jgi:hypothetical protein